MSARLKNFCELGFILALAFMLSACAGRHPKKETYGPSPKPTLSANPSGLSPGESPDPMASPAEPTKRTERPHIALVLGGAGVASFATVGLIKRFQQEGIAIDFIVATGWPAVFALGHGYLKSIHDLEWFAMRLQPGDFSQMGKFGPTDDVLVPKLLHASFPQHDLAETRIPVILATGASELWQPDTYDRGDWKEPLLKTVSLPGLFRPFDEKKAVTSSFSGLSVTEAARRGGSVIVAVDMYSDFLNSAKVSAFKKYPLALRLGNRQALSAAHFSAILTLGRPPMDFSAKRTAFLAGAREASRIAKKLRNE